MISPQDFDRLSAYLDHQLSPAEKAALEARLAREPELQATLRELRLTIRALRSLPKVKVPRSFTLTPAQVGARAGGQVRRAPFFPVLRLAATLSAVLLAVVMAGDFAGTWGAASARDTITTSGAAVQTADGTPVEAPAAELAAVTQTPTLEAGLLPYNGAGSDSSTEATDSGGGAGDDGTPVTSLLAPRPSETPTASLERSLATQDSTDKGASTPAATPTPVTVADLPPAPTDADAYAAADDQARSTTAQRPGGFPPLRLIEAALAMLTVLLGLSAWFLRRNV